MTTTATPPAPPAQKVNRIGLSVKDYRGGKTTLCAGCGHNSISERLIECCYDMGIDPTQVIKLSGIGCSSKSPAYFLNSSHGFNTVHGRMPSVATGALLANRNLIALGVTGDGDTASIGIGQFVHLMRRNIPMLYVIEDNGCYGLTKGQFSATADVGSTQKTGVANDLPPINTCALAIQLGATFVARSFSGDKKHLQSVLKAGLAHNGTSMIDVISMFGVGILGFAMRTQGIPAAPFAIAFILGPLFENEFRKSLIISQGSLEIFVSSAISITFLLLAIASAVATVYLHWRLKGTEGEKMMQA